MKTETKTNHYDGIGTQGWLAVGDRSYWIDSRNGEVPEIWVHRRPQDEAALYLKGVSLTEGTTDEEDLDYLKQIIAHRM